MTSLAELSGYYEASKKAMLVGLGYFAVTRPGPTGKVLWKVVPPLAYSMARDTYLIVRVLGSELLLPELMASLHGIGASGRAAGAAAAQPMIWGGLAQPLFFALAVPFALAVDQGARMLGAPDPAGVPEQYLTV
jgi:hypothetical protein